MAESGHPGSDIRFMRRALALGDTARQSCGPNPWVGCVIALGGEIVGEGAYVEAGGPHAEPRALAVAGDRARGATAYVTLEPCDHHGRTPPCTDALIDAGVSRVVVGVDDPDDRVSGRGIQRLRDAGIDVDVGVGRPEAEESLRPYLHHRSTGRPWCVVKAAASIDGRVAAADGTSQWITGEVARADAHRLRGQSQAVVVGSGTALADRPTLTARDVDPSPAAQPLRVLLDARGRTPAAGPLFDTDLAPTLVVTTAAADVDAVAAWKAAGVEVEEVAGAPRGGVDLVEVIARLGRRGIVQALFEGGAAVHGSLAAADLVDEMVVYVGPTILGPHGRAAFDGFDVPTMTAAGRWRLIESAVLDGDVRITWRPT